MKSKSGKRVAVGMKRTPSNRVVKARGKKAESRVSEARNDVDEVTDDTDELQDGYERCPICNRAVSPGACDVCAHFQAATWDGEAMWSDAASDYNTAWMSLSSALWNAQDCFSVHESDYNTAFWTLPEPVQRALEAAIAHEDPLYWTDEMSGTYVETGGMLSGSGWNLYHENPNRLREITADVAAAAAWVNSFVESHLDDDLDDGLELQ